MWCPVFAQTVNAQRPKEEAAATIWMNGFILRFGFSSKKIENIIQYYFKKMNFVQLFFLLLPSSNPGTFQWIGHAGLIFQFVRKMEFKPLTTLLWKSGCKHFPTFLEAPWPPWPTNTRWPLWNTRHRRDIKLVCLSQMPEGVTLSHTHTSHRLCPGQHMADLQVEGHQCFTDLGDSSLSPHTQVKTCLVEKADAGPATSSTH